MPSTLSEDGAPSASLGRVKARGSPPDPRAPPEQLGGSPLAPVARLRPPRRRGCRTCTQQELPLRVVRKRQTDAPEAERFDVDDDFVDPGEDDTALPGGLPPQWPRGANGT